MAFALDSIDLIFCENDELLTLFHDRLDQNLPCDAVKEALWERHRAQTLTEAQTQKMFDLREWDSFGARGAPISKSQQIDTMLKEFKDMLSKDVNFQARDAFKDVIERSQGDFNREQRQWFRNLKNDHLFGCVVEVDVSGEPCQGSASSKEAVSHEMSSNLESSKTKTRSKPVLPRARRVNPVHPAPGVTVIGVFMPPDNAPDIEANAEPSAVQLPMNNPVRASTGTKHKCDIFSSSVTDLSDQGRSLFDALSQVSATFSDVQIPNQPAQSDPTPRSTASKQEKIGKGDFQFVNWYSIDKNESLRDWVIKHKEHEIWKTHGAQEKKLHEFSVQVFSLIAGGVQKAQMAAHVQGQNVY